MRLNKASVVTALQLSSFLSHPHPLTPAQVFFPNHLPAHTPACQNLLPKEHGQKYPSSEEYILFEISRREGVSHVQGQGENKSKILEAEEELLNFKEKKGSQHSCLVQVHTAREKWSQDSNLGLSDTEVYVLSCYLHVFAGNI